MAYWSSDFHEFTRLYKQVTAPIEPGFSLLEWRSRKDKYAENARYARHVWHTKRGAGERAVLASRGAHHRARSTVASARSGLTPAALRRKELWLATPATRHTMKILPVWVIFKCVLVTPKMLCDCNCDVFWWWKEKGYLCKIIVCLDSVSGLTFSQGDLVNRTYNFKLLRSNSLNRFVAIAATCVKTVSI